MWLFLAGRIYIGSQQTAAITGMAARYSMPTRPSISERGLPTPPPFTKKKFVPRAMLTKCIATASSATIGTMAARRLADGLNPP